MTALLFDQNLSPRLVTQLADLYPGSAHVDTLGLGAVPDVEVWDYARRNELVIVTKDADFSGLSILRGNPPKVIWIRRGNCSTRAIATLLQESAIAINTFCDQETSGVLTLF